MQWYSGSAIRKAKLKRLYSEDINFDNLKVQLQMLPDLVHTVNKECHLGIKKHILALYVRFLILVTILRQC